MNEIDCRRIDQEHASRERDRLTCDVRAGSQTAWTCARQRGPPARAPVGGEDPRPQ
jgi:hypothetical protein